MAALSEVWLLLRERAAAAGASGGGVAMASQQVLALVQQLHQRVEQQERQLASQRRKLARFEQFISDFERYCKSSAGGGDLAHIPSLQRVDSTRSDFPAFIAQPPPALSGNW